MDIVLSVRTLIDLASEKSGQSLGELASELGRHQSRLSEWKKGTAKPDANEIAFFAEKAGLPVFETVAEIEAQLDARYASIWQRALGKLKAAGVAASVLAALILAPLMLITPKDSHAAAGQIEKVPFRHGCAVSR